jgi:hypothetical protein
MPATMPKIDTGLLPVAGAAKKHGKELALPIPRIDSGIGV